MGRDRWSCSVVPVLRQLLVIVLLLCSSGQSSSVLGNHTTEFEGRAAQDIPPVDVQCEEDCGLQQSLLRRLALKRDSAEGGRAATTKRVAEPRGRQVDAPPLTFNVFSALHDPIVGEFKIFAEVYPREVCGLVKSCHLSNGQGRTSLAVPVKSRLPFSLQSGEAERLHECFIECQLQRKGLRDLAAVTLRTEEGMELVTEQVLEQVQRPRGKGGPSHVGICTAPVLNMPPTLLDWLDYNHQMGVRGVHLYAPWEAAAGRQPAVSLIFHHLITWQLYPSSRWRLEENSQRLAYNECMFRYRHVYEFIIFLDGDEFVHVLAPTQRPWRVNILSFLRSEMELRRASGTLQSALYSVHCLSNRVKLLGEPPAYQYRTPPHLMWHHYVGYDVWQESGHLQPKFLNCSIMKHGRPVGRSCNARSVVRPLAVESVSSHFVQKVKKGFIFDPKPLNTSKVFIKHLQCLESARRGYQANTSLSLCSSSPTVDASRHTQGGVETCFESTM